MRDSTAIVIAHRLSTVKHADRIIYLRDGKVIDLIASGYNMKFMPSVWLALIIGLADINIEVKEPEPVPQRYMSDTALTQTEMVISEVKENLKDYWKSL